VAEGIEKVYVTVSSDRMHILPFFFEYGFRIEGISARRYGPGTSEFIVSKHLFYERVSEEALVGFLAAIEGSLFSIPEHDFEKDPCHWFMPPVEKSLTVRRSQVGKVSGIEIVATAGSDPPRSMSFNDFEALVYPARLALQERQAFMIPIRPQWADRMMEIPRDQGSLFAETDKLRLRTDNAYYCSPRYGPELLRGSPVLFYVSSPDSKVAGTARILECHIEEPEDLFLRYGGLGVYEIANIQGHVRKHDGKAMVIRFGWWVPFPYPVSLKDLQSDLGLYHPQTVTALDFGTYERVLQKGGFTW